MDASVLKVVGQIAGIGGISIAVVLLLFRNIIRKNIFPELTKQNAYDLIRLIVILTFVIAVLGIAAWIHSSNPAEQTLPVPDKRTTNEDSSQATTNYPSNPETAPPEVVPEENHPPLENFTVSGSVLDADSQTGLPNVQVSINDKISLTDTDGHFSIHVKGTIGELKEVYFSKKGYSPFPSQEKVNLPEDNLQVFLKSQSHEK